MDLEDINKLLAKFTENSRKHNLLPIERMYQDIFHLLKVKKGEKSKDFTSSQKFKLTETFEVLSVNGSEMIFGRKSQKPVLKYDDFAKEFKRIHEANGHIGIGSTYKRMTEQYHYVPQLVVSKCVKACPVCQARRADPASLTKPRKPVEKPVVSKGVMHRLQIDLMDLQFSPDGDQRWIVHAKDHFSNFIWAKAIASKESILIEKFLRKLFYNFGCPRILQCDNCVEVRGALKTLLEEFPSVKVVVSRPRPNQTFKNRLNDWIQQNMLGTGAHWATNLPRLVYEINSHRRRASGDVPFVMMFRRTPQSCDGPQIQEEEEEGVDNNGDDIIPFQDI